MLHRLAERRPARLPLWAALGLAGDRRIGALVLGPLGLLPGVVGRTTTSQGGTTGGTIARVDRFVDEYMRAARIPGAALAVVRRGEVVHDRVIDLQDNGSPT